MAREGSVIGRTSELTELARFLDAEPCPRALLIDGPAGVGKTTLWRAGVDDARARDMRVLVCAPAETEAALPFAAVADLLRPHVDDVLPHLPGVQRRALAGALLLDDGEGANVAPHTVAAALLASVELLAAGAPVLLAIDDVQWLDPASEDALAFAVRRLSVALPARALVARRDANGASGAVPLGLDRALDGRLQHVVAEPLDASAIYAVVRDQLGVVLTPPELERVHELSGGNPFHALQLARAIATGPRDGRGELRLPAALGDIVDERLRRLPAETLRAIAVCALMSTPTVELLERALDVSDAWPLLGPALDDGVVAPDGLAIRFTHPLLAEAARAAARPSERQALHERLARILPTSDECAQHLALCCEPPDEAVATELEAGARVAMRRGATAVAARLAEEALRFGEASGDVLVQRALLAAQTLHAAGRYDRADAALADAIDRLPRGPGRARLLVERAMWVVPAERRPLLDRVLQEADGDASVTCAAWTTIAELESETDWRRGAEAAGNALRWVDGAEHNIAARAYMSAAFLDQFGARAESDVLWQRALEHERLSERVLPEDNSPSAGLAMFVTFSDRLDEGRASYRAIAERAEAAGEESVAAAIRFRLAELEWRAGRWADAAALVRAATDYEERSGIEDLVRQSTWLGALIAVSLGAGDSERQGIEEGIEACARLGFTTWGGMHRWTLGFLHLSLGRPTEALAVLDGLAELWERTGVVDQGFTHHASDELEALILVGREDDAERRIAEEDERAERLDRPRLRGVVARARGMLASRRGQHDEAVSQLERAVAIHAAGPLPFDHGRSLLALGTAMRRGGRRRDARAALEAALELFERLGAAHWRDKARSEIGRLGGRTAAGDELTPTEERVAALVAAGLSNREIAAELVVSVRAVEANLTRIYGKRGVRTRGQLIAQARR